MKIVIISNKLTPHQIPLCQALYGWMKDEFCFVETLQSNEELPIGWQAEGKNYPFVKTADEVVSSSDAIMQMIAEADIVIIGSAPDSMIIPRLRAGGLTFKYSERPYKETPTLMRRIRRLIGGWIHHGRFQKYPLYMLCASAYTAGDYAVLGNYIGKTYKWGYFTEVKHQDLDALFARKSQNKKPLILWVARLISLKHPEAALALAADLKARGYDFQMDLIGTGPMEAELKESVKNQNLSDCVSLLGSMPPEQVRDHMERADIFLFTSDFNEGWGAVLNESMNSGCAVVASHAIGSVPFLIQDGENGLIYENGNQEQLNRKVMWLLDHPEERERLGRAACRTMEEQWNADVAAERFLKLVEHIQTGKPGSPYASGPCSVAENLKNDWYQSV